MNDRPLQTHVWTPNPIDRKPCSVCGTLDGVWAWEAVTGVQRAESTGICVCRAHLPRFAKENYLEPRDKSKPRVPPVGILGCARAGSTLPAHLLFRLGYHFGLRTTGAGFHEDEAAYELSVGTLSTQGLDHHFPDRRPDYDAADQYVREHAPAFLKLRARSFPWAFKYPTLFWGLRGWLDAAPEGRFLLVVRNVADWADSYRRQSDISQCAFWRTLEYRYEAIERALGHPRVLYLRHEEALLDPVAYTDKIAVFLGLDPFPQDVISEIRRGHWSPRSYKIEVEV